ncbi:MAG: amidohydrolase family protein [Rikenellaceae bacterium]
MRKIASHFLISGGELIQRPLVTVNDSGEIVAVEKNVENVDSLSGVEFYSGIIIPGMVNSHCHLEYSYVFGKIPAGGGLPKFISSIIGIKINDTTPDSEKSRAAQVQDAIMASEGVVAVGDHNNNDYVYEVKEKSNIYYHSFVEMYDFDDMSADDTFYLALGRVAEHEKRGLAATVSPHATYTMEDRLIALCGGSELSDKGEKATGAMSVHFKESIEMAGELEADRLLPRVSPDRDSILFVHSIYASKEDIDRAVELYGDKLTVVVCPLSNLYIENNITDINYLREKGVRIALGTDSLSSNNLLSMVAEMHCIADRYRDVPLTEIVKWATQNGAEAICKADTFGKVEVGMKCGLVNITSLDLENMRLTESSKGVRIV